jgi:D-glycero-D-manno-heptose 1,7-bisphosphate phosphatase
MSRRAIFLDRDGTIGEEMGYINHIDRWRLLPRSARAIRIINDIGFLALVVTNQSGVARGLFDLPLVGRVNEMLAGSLLETGARIDGVYVCPHHPDVANSPYGIECDCRKPRPGLLEQGARDHGIDLHSSYMIGDTLRDLETARNAGVTGILVLTGYGKGEAEHRLPESSLEPAHIARDLLDAVKWIMKREGRT